MTAIARAAAAIPRYHLAYLTANDGRDFSIDYLNFRNLSRRHPGVSCVDLTIAISGVRTFSAANKRQVEALLHLVSAVQWLRVTAVIWKGNIGRDFSSAEACLRSMADGAHDEDYVMVCNRSGYGPLTDRWYSRYIDQYRRRADSGLVGNTIHLGGPSELPADFNPCHVQTYVYLSQWRHFRTLLADFPGRGCRSNPEAILSGEIGLSHRILTQGLSLSCLCWPDHFFTATSVADPALPRRDIKAEVGGLPFHYKFPAYRRAPIPQIQRLLWVFFTALVSRCWWRRPASNARQLCPDDYDA